MSDQEEKIKHGKRIQRNQNAIAKQLKIAKKSGLKHDEPNRFKKRHAMDCGRSNCSLCGNPRHLRTHKDKLTRQEKRLFQDMDAIRAKRGNGTNSSEE